MNPLIEAMKKSRSANDYGGDLHTRKDSHMSAPMQGMEWHFSTGDMNVKAQVNQTYVVCVPVICTSSDDHDVRFRQVAKPYLDDKAVFEKGGSDETAVSDKAPMVRTQTEPA